MPLESQSPENVLLLSVMEQYPRRPVLIDFSTRYSVPFTNYRFLQRGITYQLVTGQADAEESECQASRAEPDAPEDQFAPFQ